jgi:hypothetical protein
MIKKTKSMETTAPAMAPAFLEDFEEVLEMLLGSTPIDVMTVPRTGSMV